MNAMTSIAPWLRQMTEADPAVYVPYAGHVRPNVVLTMQNNAIAVAALHGSPFELSPMPIRAARIDRINTLLMQLSNPDLSLHFHLVHHRGSKPAPQLQGSGIAGDILRSYAHLALHPDKLFRNDWFISAVVRQPDPSKSKFKTFRQSWKVWKERQAPPLELSDTAHRTIEDVFATIMSTLEDDYQPRRLGLSEIEDGEGGTIPITEIGTALRLMRTAHFEPVPHTAGPLAAAIYADPVDVREDYFDLHLPGVERVGAMLSMGTYPLKPRIGMYNSLLAAPYPLVMNHRFDYRSSGSGLAKMVLTRRQMANAGDPAEDMANDMKDAASKAGSMREVSAGHHFGLAVYAHNRTELDRNVADAGNRLAKFGGAVATRERNRWNDGALESAYYLQLPACVAFQPRPATVSSMDMAKMVSLDNYPEGDASGHWGPSILRVRTNGNTACDLVLHDEDVGHFGSYGPNGRGKTALLGVIIAANAPAMGDNGITLLIDKDESNRLLIEATGGKYQGLHRNRPSGLAPLVAFGNTPRAHAYLHQTYRYLIHRDPGRPQISNDEDRRLARGIARQLAMPPRLRSMGGIREFLGYKDRDNGAGARFERYCQGGSMGWLLDNREHNIALGAGLYGFDFTELLPKDGEEDDGACQIAASVIAHQLFDLADGRRIAVYCDESRFYLEALQRLLEDMILTGRKKELLLGMLAQQPEHHTNTSIGMSLVAQMRTKFLAPDPGYDVTTLVEKLKLSPAAARMLTGEMTIGNMRRFLMWRPPNKSIVFDFDLSSLPQLGLLSGRPRTVTLMEKIRETHPDPAEAVAEFCRQTQRKAAA